MLNPIYLILLLLLPNLALANVGRVQFAYGNVTVTDQQGIERFVHKGDTVNEGDLIRSKQNAAAQIVFIDKSMLLIRSDSQLRIKAYVYQSNRHKNNHSLLSLISGNIRSITGLIGKYNHKKVRIRTPIATIGIRGSDADIGFDPTQQLTAVRTLTGSHYLTTQLDNGKSVTITTQPGQIAIALPGQAPRYSKRFPFITQLPKRHQSAKQKKEKRPSRKPPRKQQIKQQIKQHMQKTPAPKPPPQLPSNSGNIDLRAPTVANANAAAVTSISIQTPDGLRSMQQVIREDNPQQSILFDRENDAIIAITDQRENGDTQFIAGQAQLIEHQPYQLRDTQGKIVAAGSWGVWHGDFAIFNQERLQATTDNFHFVTTNNITTRQQLERLNGTEFNYTPIGGTASNETGALATDFEINAQGRFTDSTDLGQITVNLNANFSEGSSQWQNTGTGSVDQLINGGLPMTGTCNNCNMAQGTASGLLIGPQAEGLLLGVGLNDGSQHYLNTNAVLQR